MKFVIDDKIPYIKGALEAFGEVLYLPGKATTSEVVRDADALITRTRTRCNAELLEGSSVKMIATATIGYDHIDTAYCAEKGIEWTNAPGCNSWSVAQYIMAALHHLAKSRKLPLDELTLGVVGAGNVGSKVARLAALIGMKVLVNDPNNPVLKNFTGKHPGGHDAESRGKSIAKRNGRIGVVSEYREDAQPKDESNKQQAPGLFHTKQSNGQLLAAMPCFLSLRP